MGDVVLMVFAYALNEINEKWVMKIETNKLMCIRKNVEYLGTNVSIKFLSVLVYTKKCISVFSIKFVTSQE